MLTLEIISIELHSFGWYISFLRASRAKSHKLGGLKQQKLILLQFWKLKVRNQGASKVGSFWKSLKEILF